jgi:hypothetical protein
VARREASEKEYTPFPDRFADAWLAAQEGCGWLRPRKKRGTSSNHWKSPGNIFAAALLQVVREHGLHLFSDVIHGKSRHDFGDIFRGRFSAGGTDPAQILISEFHWAAVGQVHRPFIASEQGHCAASGKTLRSGCLVRVERAHFVGGVLILFGEREPERGAAGASSDGNSDDGDDFAAEER